jgi:hypothetical protein
VEVRREAEGPQFLCEGGHRPEQAAAGVGGWLNEKKQDPKVREAALCEALERGARRHDDRDLLAELVELRERVTEVQADRVSEAEELAHW